MQLIQVEQIFAHQAELMHKYHPIEVEHGYSPPPHPLDLSTREGQDRMRQFAWWVTEEILEAYDAPHHDYPGELSDILHFLTEMCILAGITPAQVVDCSYAPRHHPLHMVLESMGSSIRLLKGKPWKKQFTAPSLTIFRVGLISAYRLLWEHCECENLSPYTIYFDKNAINHTRIQTGY